MTTWHWVRHGPTHQKVFTGWRDVPADLSDTAGIARLDAHLPDGAVLVASDLKRASSTADRLAAGRRRLADKAALREFHFGDWDGRGFREISDEYPDLSRRYWERPGDTAPPGGESWNQAAARVQAALDLLSARHAGRHIVVVAHFGVILTQLQRALGVAAAEVLAHRIDPLSVTELRQSGGGWEVMRINHIA